MTKSDTRVAERAKPPARRGHRLVGLALGMVLALGPAWGATETPSYLLGTGDKLRVTVFGEPDLSGEFEVSATGTLSLPLIGAVSTVDRTLEDLEASIIAKLKDGYLKNPKIAVEVLEYRPFYILGDVKNSGSYPYVSGMTVLNAIALAGGNFLSEDDAVRLRLELTRAREQLELLRGEYRAASARQARLVAERDGRKRIAFPKALIRAKDDPAVAEIINGENRLFKARREALVGGIDVLQSKKSQSRELIAALDAQMAADGKQLELVRMELADIEQLLKKGHARKTQYTSKQRAAAGIEGDQLENLALIARVKQDIGELDIRVMNLRNAQLKEVMDELQEVQRRISSLKHRLQAATEVMRQTEAKAGRASASMLARETFAIRITRNSATGPEEFEASESTPVFPGDIIKVPGLNSLTGYRAPTRAGQVMTE